MKKFHPVLAYLVQTRDGFYTNPNHVGYMAGQTVVRDLIRDAVDRLRDEDRWSDALAQEVSDIREMQEMIET